MSGLLAGGVAVFETANQAGTVGLLTVGGLSGLIALVGKVPLRWVVGGAEVDMTYDETVDTADALADMLTPEQLDELSRRLLVSTKSPTSLPSTGQLRLASTLERASEVEREGHERFRRLAGLLPGDWTYSIGEAFPTGSRHVSIPDGILRTPDGVTIGVDFKAWGENITRARQHETVKKSRDAVTATALDAILIVADSRQPHGAFPRPLSMHSDGADQVVGFATFGDSLSAMSEEIERLRRSVLRKRESGSRSGVVE